MVTLVSFLLAAVSVDGDSGLSAANVEDVLRFSSVDLAPCTPDGGVTVHFQVSAGGDATAPADASVADCRLALAGLRFPPSTRDTVVHVPAGPPGSLATGPEGDGGLTSQQVRGVLEAHRGPIASCYDAAEQLTPGIDGEVAMELVVGPSGVVLSSWPRTRGGLEKTPVEKCIMQALRWLRFPMASRATVTASTWRLSEAPDSGLKSQAIVVRRAEVLRTGGLDKDVILKVIKHHQNEIKFCYEMELQKNRELAGTVKVRWLIGPAGAVLDTGVLDDTLNNARVTECIRGRIARWRFPAPAGGGAVSVTFPWIFKSAEGD
ncbi:MAG: AgmX/PglI C-terminal domain-containing protein [Archangium sp.]|nr:AgmX/PglI C-terminal domain-containing protein [Archangium sp.]